VKGKLFTRALGEWDTVLIGDARAEAHRLRGLTEQGTDPRVDVATCDRDMNLPGWGLHPLTDALKGHWAVSVNGNWRMTFTFEGFKAAPMRVQPAPAMAA